MNRKKSGIQGEALALAYLLKQGYNLLAKNYRAERCEVDLILRDGDTIAFVEVKARANAAYGLGREAVTKKKQQNIIKVAQAYLAACGMEDANARFDVVEVDLAANTVAHIPGAFTL